MNQPVPIHELSSDLGLTSRTLRHWESEGLFTSLRYNSSGRRLYDNEAVVRIRITMYLRRLDISLKDIKSILEQHSFESVKKVILKELHRIDDEQNRMTSRRRMLLSFLDVISNSIDQPLDLKSFEELAFFMENTDTPLRNTELEGMIMTDPTSTPMDVRFVTLPPMRTVYHIAVGVAPEGEALAPIMDWLGSSNLLGTARIFGGNMAPMPSKTTPEYGYGVCASIPENIEIPSHLKEMRLPGGLYAMALSSDDIYASWQSLVKTLSENAEYTSDRSRLCLEEHIRNDNPEEEGNSFYLYLLEPVKKKAQDR